MDISNGDLDHEQDSLNNNLVYNGIGIKRRRMVDTLNMITDKTFSTPTDVKSSSSNATKKSRKFLHLESNSGVYQTDNLKQSKDGDTLYLPLDGDLFVNLQNADEITFEDGIFFIADGSGIYSNSIEGTAMNIWRYSDSRQQMIVARSLLITQPAVFEKIKDYLLDL